MPLKSPALKKINRFLIFKIVKWSILPISLAPIILNILVLVSSGSNRSEFEANAYFIRFDLQDAQLSKVIKGVNSTVLEEIKANYDVRESFSFGLLNDCSGFYIEDDYKIKNCSNTRPDNGVPFARRFETEFQWSIKDQYPQAYVDFPEDFVSDLKEADKNYKAITGLSILSLALSLASSITYFISLFIVSDLFILGVTTSIISAVSLLVVAIIAISTNVRVMRSFNDIDDSFNATLGSGTIYVCNWLAAAFQCLIVAMLFTLYSIRTVTFKMGVKFKFKDVLNNPNKEGEVSYYETGETVQW